MDTSTSDIQETLEHQRESIAGEIHDTLFPYLFATRMRLDALLDRVPQEQTSVDSHPQSLSAVRDEIAQAIESLNQAMIMGRRLIGELHSPEVDVVTWSEQISDAVKRFGPDRKPKLEIHGDYDFFFDDQQHRLAARRIAQESISNAIRHGRASTVCVTVIETANDTITLTISDDGRGFDPVASSSNGHGTRIMKARAISVGGTFVLESKIGGPTRVSLICHR